MHKEPKRGLVWLSLQHSLLFLLLLLYLPPAGAQIFVQSSYVGVPNIPTCNTCTLGQVEYRFTNQNLGSNSGGNPTFNFDVQLRAGSGVEPFDYYSGTVYLSYNTAAFGQNVFSGANPACTVTANPETLGRTDRLIQYSKTIVNNNSSIGAITYRVTAPIPLALIPIGNGEHLQIDNNYKTLFNVSCEITDANTTAGFAFNALSWDQVFRRDPATGLQADGRAGYVAIAANSLLNNLLFEAPVISEVRLWQNNMGVDLLFSEAIIVADRTSSFWVARNATATTMISTTATLTGGVNLSIEFAGSANTIGGAMLIVGQNGVAEAGNSSVTYPSTRALIALPPSTNDLEVTSINLRNVGGNQQLQLVINNFNSYSGSSFGLVPANFTVPGLTVTGVNTGTSGIVLAVAGVTRGTSSISVLFANRQTCIGSACIRPILSNSISTIQAGTPNFPDVFGPIATYTITNRGSVSPGFGGVLNYTGITYRVTFNEDVASPTAELVQRTRDGNVSAVPGVSMTITGGPREYTFTQSGNAVYNPSAFDSAAEYYIRLSATDANGNPVENRDAPANQRIATIRAIVEPVPNSNDLWVVVDYGSPVSITNSGQLANASISVRSSDTIVSASITTPALGLPTGTAIGGVDGASVIHFRLTPAGTLDNGESARGNEVFAFTLPANTVSAGGVGNSGDAIEFSAIDNGNPEITSLELHSQENTLLYSAGATAENPDGSSITSTTFTLGDIVYRMRTTEPVSLSREHIGMYSISDTPQQAEGNLMTGASYSDSAYTLIASATSIVLVAGQSDLYEVTFSGISLTREGSDGAFPGGLVAVIEAAAFSDTDLEDCSSSTWYTGVRTAVRTTPCISEDAAEAPDVSALAAVTITLTNRGTIEVLTGSDAGKANYSDIVYTATFDADLASTLTATLRQRTQSEVDNNSNPNGTVVSSATLVTSVSGRTYTFTQSDTFQYDGTVTGSSRVAEYYLHLALAADSSGNAATDIVAPAGQRIRTPPTIRDVWLWAENNGISFNLHEPIEAPRASDFFVAAAPTASAVVRPTTASFIAYSIGRLPRNLLYLEFPSNAGLDVDGLSVFVAPGGITALGQPMKTYSSTASLASLPDYNDDLRIRSINITTPTQIELILETNQTLDLVGATTFDPTYVTGNYWVQKNLSEYRLDNALWNPVPISSISTATVTGGGTKIVLDVSGIDRNTRTISVFPNPRSICRRGTTSCIRTVLRPDQWFISVPDFFAPSATITLSDRGTAQALAGPDVGKADYSGIVYTVAFDEVLVSTPTATLHQRTQSEVDNNSNPNGTAVPGVTLVASVRGRAAYTFTQSGTFQYDGTVTGGDRIAEYYLHIASATDNSSNTVTNITAPDSQRIKSSTIPLLRIADTFRLHTKLFLEAAVDRGWMQLQSVMPADDPYCGTGAIGTATIPSTGTFQNLCEDITLTVGQGAAGGNSDFPDGVVDWVLVEVRDAIDAASATTATVVARKPALLLSNGRVVDAQAFVTLSESDRSTCVMASTPTSSSSDPCPAVSLGTAAFGGTSPTITSNAFLVMRHRNHLDIQSANPVPLISNVGSYDFTTSADRTLGSMNAVKRFSREGNTVYAMIAGDANGNNQVQLSDTVVMSSNLGNAGYFLADVNLDGQVSLSDFFFIAQNNNIGRGALLGSIVVSSCSACTLGQVEYRFANQSLGTDTDGDATFNFDVQLRTVGGAESFDYYSGSVYLNYNTAAFGANAFSGASPACTVTASPETLDGTFGLIQYLSTIVNTTSDIGAITYQASAGLPFVIAPVGSGTYTFIDSTYKTLFAVSCKIADASAPAGFAFNPLTWDQVFRRDLTRGTQADGSARYLATAANNLLNLPLFEAPIITEAQLWQDNRGVNLVFDRPITESNPASFWVAQNTTATSTISAVATTLTGGVNLGVEFADSADAISNAMLIARAGSVVSAVDAAHTYPSRTILAALPPSSSDLRITNIALRNVGGNHQLQLTVDNFSSYPGSFSGLMPANFVVPGLTVTGVSTDTSGIALTVTGLTRGTSSISVMFANRQTCIGSACIRPILSNSISTIQAGTANFPDVFGPIATYTLTDRGTTAPGAAAGTLNYSGIVYSVTFNEDVMNPTAELVQRTRGNTVTSVSGATMSCTGGPRAYTCTQSGNATFDLSAADLIVEYYLRLSSATDASNNPVANPDAPANQRIATIRTVVEQIANSNNLRVVVDYAIPVTVTSATDFTAENATITVNSNGGTITGASISDLTTGLGSSTTAASQGISAASAISFVLTPTGTLDGGESATGVESFSFTPPAGSNIPTDAIEFNAIANGAPEVTSLELHSQNNTLLGSVDTRVVNPDGSSMTNTTFTLGDIVYRMRATEPVSLSRDHIWIYSLADTPQQAAANLMAGASYSGSAYTRVASATSIALVAGQTDLYEVTFRNVSLTREGSNGTFPGGLVAVIEAAAFSDTDLEDCSSSTWYAGVRTAVRTTPCISEDAATTPDVSAPTATIILTNRGTTQELTGSDEGRVNYSGIVYTVTFDENLAYDPTATLRQRTQSEVDNNSNPNGTFVSGAILFTSVSSRTYTFTQSGTFQHDGTVTGSNRVAEYYLHLESVTDNSRNTTSLTAPLDQRIRATIYMPRPPVIQDVWLWAENNGISFNLSEPIETPSPSDFFVATASTASVIVRPSTLTFAAYDIGPIGSIRRNNLLYLEFPSNAGLDVDGLSVFVAPGGITVLNQPTRTYSSTTSLASLPDYKNDLRIRSINIPSANQIELILETDQTLDLVGATTFDPTYATGNYWVQKNLSDYRLDNALWNPVPISSISTATVTGGGTKIVLNVSGIDRNTRTISVIPNPGSICRRDMMTSCIRAVLRPDQWYISVPDFFTPPNPTPTTPTDVSAPVATITLTNRGRVSPGSSGTLEYTGITYSVVFDEDLASTPTATLRQRTQSEVNSNSNPNGTAVPGVALDTSVSGRTYTFTQNGTFQYDGTATGGNRVAEYYLHIASAADNSGNTATDIVAPAGQRITTPPPGATDFAQSNYVGMPNNRTCSTCILGRVEYRFANQGLGIDSDGDGAFSFDVQLRTGIGVEAFDFFTSTVFLSYNATAFGTNIFAGATQRCTVTPNSATLANPGGATYSPTIVDNTSSIGAITYRAGQTPLRFAPIGPEGGYVQISNDWTTLFNVSCKIANANAPAGFAFNALTWDQVTRRDPTTGDADGSAGYSAIAVNSLSTRFLFEAPNVTEVQLWQDNRGVNLVFDRAITAPSASSFWVAQNTTATSTIAVSTATLIGGVNLRLEFANSADAISNAMLIASTASVISLANAAETYPSSIALAALPQSSNDLRVTNIDLRNAGRGQYQLQLAVDNFASYGGALFGFTARNFAIPGLSVIRVSTDTSGIVLDVTGVTRATSSISITFANRRTCIGSACIRPILPNSISTIRSGTANFPDVFGPIATYTITNRGSVTPGSSGTLDYSGIVYRVVFDEDVISPTAELAQRTRSGVVAVVSGVTMTTAGGPREYTFTQSGNAEFNPAAADPVAEYFIRLTAADASGNPAENRDAPANQRISTLRITARDRNDDSNTIPDNAPAGTAIAGLDLVVTDVSNNPITEPVTWSITNSQDLFTIGATSGQVTLMRSPDFEATSRHTITVQVVIDSDTNISNTIELTIDVLNISALTITQSAGGVVRVGSDIECGTRDRYGSDLPQTTSVHTNCSYSYDSGSTVTLVATPNHAQTFVGWLGDCQGESSQLDLRLDGPKICQAVFAEPTGYIQIAASRIASNITSFVVASNHACALTPDGGIHCWGRNNDGQLGDGTETNRAVPTPVMNISTAIAISAGEDHTCAVLADGQARCWGRNFSGQLGDGVGIVRRIPTAVVGISTAIAISAGEGHTCAVLADGQARCWGRNSNDQLGDGTTAQERNTPTTVTGINTAVAISAGGSHTCAVLESGQARCWGRNSDGQLGDGTSTRRTTPTAVSGINTAVAISAGGDHTCAVLRDGQARCWGSNHNRQLGDGTSTRRTTPTAVSGINTATAVSAGEEHTCAVLSDGQARCWGRNVSGQLGNGMTANRVTPTAVTGINTAMAISVGESHSCAVLSNGQARCWGRNSDGQLGDGTSTRRTTPTAVSDISTVIAISAGEDYTCAVLRGGQARCWGDDTFDQSGGTGSAFSPITTPRAVPGITTAVAVSAGTFHTCAVLESGQARCWGSNLGGRLGDGTTENRAMPAIVLGIAAAMAVSVGENHTCAVLSGGQVYCWGRNGSGQLGDGTSTFTGRPTPAPVSGINTATTIAVGDSHTCAVLSDGQVRCWGRNRFGQLGDGTLTSRPTPTPVSGVNTATAVAAGSQHTCAVLRGGQVRCWGRNSSGQLGDGTFISRPTATAVSGINTATAVSAGKDHTCAVLRDGQVRCWGRSGNGLLGEGTETEHISRPTIVSSVSTVAQVSAGYESSCALLRNGLAYCWGSNSDGGVGNGDLPDTYLTPQLVANQPLTPNALRQTGVTKQSLVFQPRVGATGSTVWSISPPAPTGLRFSTQSGVLYGISTTTQVAPTYTITARSANGDTDIINLSLSITVGNDPESIAISDANPTSNTIAENATTDARVLGIDLTATDEFDNVFTNLTWNRTGGSAQYDIVRGTGIVTLVDASNLTEGATATLVVQATAPNGVQSNELTLEIAVTKAIPAIRFHLKLFLEGPLQ